MSSEQSVLAPLKETSLWNAGLKTFRLYWRQWLPLGLVFFVLALASNGALTHYAGPWQEQLELYKNTKNAQALVIYLKESAPFLTCFTLIWSAVLYAQHYLFLNFFITRDFPAQSEKASLREFFCFFVRGIQLTCLFVAPAFAFATLIIIMGFVSKMAASLTTLVSTLIIIAGFFYLLIKSAFVMPLASGRIDKPFTNSWRLTKNNWWRLLGNFLMILLILISAYFLVSIALFFIALIFGFTSNTFLVKSMDGLGLFVRYVLSSGFQTLMAGILAAFYSTACRILYNEKTLADPGFVLTKRV